MQVTGCRVQVTGNTKYSFGSPVTRYQLPGKTKYRLQVSGFRLQGIQNTGLPVTRKNKIQVTGFRVQVTGNIKYRVTCYQVPVAGKNKMQVPGYRLHGNIKYSFVYRTSAS
jgi:hypothetical protein